MASKFYQVEKIINGTKYVAQFNGVSAALQAMDESYIDGSNNISVVKLNKYLLENVIVEPGNLTLDDFTSLEDLNQVAAFARKVMQGELKPQDNQTEKK